MKRVDSSSIGILLIDVQPFFLEGWMAGAFEPFMTRIEHLLGLATAYHLPTIATFEQPVDTKGWLPGRLEPWFPKDARKLTKQTFDCTGEPEIRAAIAGMGVRQFAVAGGETDVCVLQSVLGVLEMGYDVFLLEDALFSEEPNTAPALRRMEHAGAIPSTVKTLHYELRRSVGAPKVPELLDRAGTALPMRDPEDLPNERGLPLPGADVT
ncbi:MAG: isochorismatase family protein [Thermomicrobiales bacterium]|nr:isochorismatase family protein [Thermomicrobiales bacterium]MCO5220658.1 isochorismatase family protein [Thermomicrobiales bacterium]